MLFQHAIRAKKDKTSVSAGFKRGVIDIYEGLVAGARNMVSVGVATAAAGIVVGVVTMGLGGLVTDIIDVLSMGNLYLMLIIVANLIAWPIAWVFMNKWLDSFAYHIEISPLVYILAAGAAVFIALITVSSQTIKAAMTNPSNALRYE